MTNENRNIANLFDQILDREREVLMSGEFSEIPGLVDQKTILLEQLNDLQGPDSAQLENLQTKALRNQELLDNALQGIRHVANRFATLRKLSKSLETYDERGLKTSLPSAVTSKVERRA